MPTGLTRDSGWEIGVSRTIDATVDAAWSFLVSDAGMALWVGPGASLPAEPGDEITTDDGGTGELRSRRPPDRVRVQWQPAGWDHRSIVQVVVSGGPERARVAFHQEHLASGEERERQRAHWKAVLDQVEAALT